MHQESESRCRKNTIVGSFSESDHQVRAADVQKYTVNVLNQNLDDIARIQLEVGTTKFSIKFKQQEKFQAVLAMGTIDCLNMEMVRHRR